MCYNRRMITSTRFQKSIKNASDSANVLKPGSNNKKLGFNVTSKRWAGKKLYSLTLVERETCPTSCHHWEDCYGNNMPFAHRYSTDNLEAKLETEIAALIEAKPDGIVIRLHVLGDFYSVDYVKFWEDMLFKFPKLCLFGYTGRQLDTRIGNAIRILNLRFGERCVIRHSWNKDSNGLAELYAAEESFEGDSFTCPEQTGKVKNCASCGLCWTSTKTVKFLSH